MVGLTDEMILEDSLTNVIKTLIKLNSTDIMDFINNIVKYMKLCINNKW